MNFESGSWRRGALEDDVLDLDEDLQRRNRRRIIIAALVAVALAIALLVYFSTRGGDDQAVATAAANKGALPAVTVIVPGRQQVPHIITTTGTMAAKRDMPVGVTGEGGQVTRVLVERGAWVGAGQPLLTIERSVQSEEAKQLAASVEVARADARLAQQELDRAQTLVSRGFISKADVERLTATRDSANARVRVAQAQLGQSQARIGRLDLRAPAAGLVLDRMVEPGQVVSSGAGALFRIAQGGQMEMVARMTQEDLAQVSVGIPATVTPVGATQHFKGQVWQVSPVIDPQTRQGEVRILLGYDPLLRPGGFASAEIRAGSTDAPLLPDSAVQSDDKGNFVYIVGDDNKVARRAIKVAAVTDNGVIVSQGLNGNERVVLSAGAFLNPGDQVRPTRARATQ